MVGADARRGTMRESGTGDLEMRRTVREPAMVGSKGLNPGLSKPSPSRKLASWAFVGALAGPVIAFLFSFTRIGPPGFLWFEGKGGETFQTPLGRLIEVIWIVGSWLGTFSRWQSKRGIGPKPASPSRRAILRRSICGIASLMDDQFQRVGHSLFTLLAGLLGGTVAVWFYMRRERARSGATGEP